MKFPAKLIWSDPHGLGRNRYVLFRKVIDLDFEPEKATLNIFADTRYRLVVNGQTLCHGPSRFRHIKPEFDTVDILPWLQEGANVIAVIVNSYGTISYHSEVGPGCLVTWGEVLGEDQQVSLSSDEGFKAIDDPTRRGDTPHMSFALNPAEYYDATKMDEAWMLADFDDSDWPDAVAIEDTSAWGQLHPRSIPMLDERYVTPAGRLGVWAARPRWNDHVQRLLVVDEQKGSVRTGSTAGALAYLHSPSEQEIILGAWWGRYFLNGREIEPGERHNRSLRQDFSVKLNEGWNELQVWETMNRDTWALQLGVPEGSGVTIRGEKDLDSQVALRYVEPIAGKLTDLPFDLPVDVDALPDGVGPWRDWMRSDTAAIPYYERGWMHFEKIVEDNWKQVEIADLAAEAGCDSIAICYDFGNEMLGRPEIAFEAAEGTTIDLSYSERLKPDNLADIHYRYHVEMTERCVAGEGRQVWHTFHPRGFRYLEIRVTGDLSRFKLASVGMTRANYPSEHTGWFSCSDERLNEVWRIGANALHACMEDAYLDCPHRERGAYSGDMLQEFLANMAVTGDTDLYARTIELFLLGQGEDGLVPGGAHGLSAGHLSDYSAIVVNSMWQHWAHTGDLNVTRRLADRMVRVVEGLEGLIDPADGVVVAENNRPYLDLSYMKPKIRSCALNAFCYGAFRDAAALLDKIDDDRAGHWRQAAEKLAKVIVEAFWDADKKLFRDGCADEAADSAYSVAGNATAAYFDLTPEEGVDSVVDWLADSLANNFREYPPGRNDECNVTSYFSYYPLDVLYRHGRNVEAEAFIRRYFGWMLDHGAWTTWEYFVDSGGASLCHAWSAHPCYFMAREVLGVRFVPGEPNVVELDPKPGTLEWAQGAVPHPLGTIEIRWRNVAGDLDLQVEAPEDIEIRMAEK